MERMVFEVALKGDVESLKRLLDEDPLALERSMASVYSDTPLHVAAMLGYQDFANEILRRKPQLAKDLNSNQSSPLHLVAAMGHVSVVRCLLLADRGMCKARDRDGLTPFHLAAVKGRVEVLKELIMSDGHEICSSELLSEVMGMDGEKLGESILHMCVKYGQLEALKFVVEMIGDDADFVNSKDAFGNTVLHLAVEYKQFEAVKFLVQRSTIQVKAENGKGLTAMDTLFQSRNNNNNINVKEMEIGEALVVGRDNNSKESENWVNEMREGLMVAASLLATMAFQAVVSPPGGVLQNDDKPINFFYNKNEDCSLEELPQDQWLTPIAGISVLSYYQQTNYTVFMVANTLSFLASVSVILLLISGLPLHRKLFMYIMMITMWVAITAAAVSYIACLQMTTLVFSSAYYILIPIWVWLFAILAVIIGVGNIIKVTVVVIKWLPKAFKTRRPNKNSTTSIMYQA
nr:ankyrin repeat-containing protein BDA1-like [Ipomoea batatas]GME00642.1 ankyrin repeat-containing protein BDA1-like [Ipomoea batatas]GME15045.1 ankyrin repeat-containing protein BDA1-like [Ipomoea batatas]